MSAASERLTHCPICRYDLTGLPRNHRCPECGFEYDETTVVWRPPIFPRWQLSTFWLILSMLASIDFNAPRLVQSLGFSRSEASAIVFFLSGIPSFIGLYYPRGLVVVSRCGVTSRGPVGAITFVPWRQIRVEDNGSILQLVERWTPSALMLPTGGLTRRRRRLLDAIIAERWRAAGGADGEAGGRETVPPDA